MLATIQFMQRRFSVNVHSPMKRCALWLHNMRIALEKRHIGWAMWGYQDNFGVVTKKNGTTVLDPVILDALGLNRAK
jgi:endoglucanase